MKCQICNKEEAIAKVKDKTNKILFICPYCEPENIEVLEILNQNNYSNISPIPRVSNDINEIRGIQQGEVRLGRLHKVSKTRVISVCRQCNKDISKGSECYNQSYQDLNTFFPIQTKVCLSCGLELIKKGIEVVEK